jgi:vacuolar-type H+-ATPase subunit F/Vma7
MKVLVIGHPKAVLGFSLAGVQGQVATNAEEANRALDSALGEATEVGIVLVTQDVAALIANRMEDLRLHSTVPLVVEIPGPEGVNPDQASLSDVVLKAIGVKI